MIELLKSPLDIGATGTASALRRGVIPGMDPLSDEVWKLKPEERKKRTLAFPLEKAGEIAGKTGTATNADGKTSDVWLLLFVPGPPGHPESGVMLGFWMGKDSKIHSLGERGSTGGAGFAESGGRNWVHSAATVLEFLQKGRGLLKPGYKFRPLVQDDVPTNGVKVLTVRGRQEKGLQLTAGVPSKELPQTAVTNAP
jgi:membrane peptidoglycan carboxypeptidase